MESPVEAHGVAFDHLDVWSVSDDLAQDGHDPSIDLKRGHRGTGVGQGQRERAEPRTDLDDSVAGPDAGKVGDPAHGVRVGDEVLPQIAPRSERMLRRGDR